MRVAVVLAAALAVTITAVAWIPSPRSRVIVNEPLAITVGSEAPPFSLPDANGAVVTLADYRGRVVMLNFWATWCGGCRLELPWLSDFHRRYEAEGLVSVGLALDDEGWAAVGPFLREHPVSFRTVVADWSLAARYDVMGLPLTLLVDREGRVAASHLGVIDPDAWEREIQRVLAQPAGRR